MSLSQGKKVNNSLKYITYFLLTLLHESIAYRTSNNHPMSLVEFAFE
ncbi:hypothetical protein I587_00169 [Enterococcus mundtii ATCC 882]|nr:hypothetical protein UAC_02670 [Enterococcus mundtii ATCC 882]EOU11654.1 hypothetical protein I587_00169 [Enterococcus mundtii ATCC 882]